MAHLPNQTKAVALSYDATKDNAPRVVASGRGYVAEEILRLAFDNGVKVRKDETLTEILSLVDLDQEIPLEALVAVAEILAHVYRENNRLAALKNDKTAE